MLMEYKIKKHEKYAWLRLAVAISSSLIFIGILSIYLDYFLKPEFNFWLAARTLIAVMLLLGSLYWTNYERKKFSSIVIPVESDLALNKRTFEALIMPLSLHKSINTVFITSSDSDEILNIINDKNDKLLPFKKGPGHDSLKDLKALLLENIKLKEGREIFSNWQPPLISIIRNLKQDNGKGLKQLWLIGSEDKVYSNKPDKPTAGSAGQLKHFIKILLFFFKDYFDIYVYNMKNNVPIKIDPSKDIDGLLDGDVIEQIGLDFDDFRQVYESFEEIIPEIVKISKKEGGEIEEHRIAIDITGAQKPISVAGAIATLRFKTRVVYVNTNNLPDMKEIDAAMETKQEL